MTSPHNTSSTRPHVMIMAAGTGGHIFPALAVAIELREHGLQVSWLGTPAGMENRLVPPANFPLFPITMSGVRGNGIKRLLTAPFKLLLATLHCMRLFSAERVDAVVGFGGYITGPGGLAARLMGLPLIIHEQNAIAGLSNKLLKPIASQVLQAFPDTFAAHNKVATTGNPLREAICSIPAPSLRPKRSAEHPLNILVVGGSLGAQVFNEALPPIWQTLNQSLRITHQCGEKHMASAQQHYQPLASFAHIEYQIVPFIDDMAKAYSEADLVVCRAGALTVCEIAMVGVAAIFVPLPSAVDDHQTQNARYLTDQSAAVLCPQSALRDTLASILIPLLHRDVLHDMANKARTLAFPDATKTVCAHILKTIGFTHE